MATARRRYFLVADSVLREAWSNDELATLVRLMAYMHERWRSDGITPEQACEVELSSHALAIITHLDRPARQIARIEALSRHVSLTFSVQHRSPSSRQEVASPSPSSSQGVANPSPLRSQHVAKIVTLRWPKFAEFQKLHTRDSAETRPKVGPPVPVPVPVPVLQESEGPLQAPVGLKLATANGNGAHPKRTRKRGERRAPEDFDLTAERRDFAVRECGLLVVQAQTEFDKFCDYEFRTPRTDWDASWRNWARSAAERIRQTGVRR